MEGICVNFLDPIQCFQFLKGRCHGNQLKSKNWRILRTNLLCRAAIRKWTAISQFWFHNIDRMNISTLCTISVTFRPETSEFSLLTIAPFVALWQKLAYHAKYLRMFWNYLDLLYRFVGKLVEMLFQIFVLQRPKGRCYGNQLYVGDVRKRRMGPSLLFASAFDNGLADHKCAFKRFNGNNQATSCPNLVNLSPVISVFMLLKRAIFAAIHPQFDDDLHSSPCHFQTDWKSAILISAD